MALSERALEENEVKLDNILHKILKAAHNIRDLNSDITVTNDSTLIEERSRCIGILTKTITTLTTLAAEINIVDESITTELENQLGNELNIAIENIKKAKELLEK